MSILQTQARLVADYQSLPAWEERYQKIIALGRALPPMPEEFRTEANQVRGCSSTVWLFATVDSVGGKDLITYHSDSDAAIPKGLAALLVHDRDGQTAQGLRAGADCSACLTCSHTISSVRRTLPYPRAGS